MASITLESVFKKDKSSLICDKSWSEWNSFFAFRPFTHVGLPLVDPQWLWRWATREHWECWGTHLQLFHSETQHYLDLQIQTEEKLIKKWQNIPYSSITLCWSWTKLFCSWKQNCTVPNLSSVPSLCSLHTNKNNTEGGTLNTSKFYKEATTKLHLLTP